ncbi:hypothetical protein D3C77_594020 [compost metagenome]
MFEVIAADVVAIPVVAGTPRSLVPSWIGQKESSGRMASGQWVNAQLRDPEPMMPWFVTRRVRCMRIASTLNTARLVLPPTAVTLTTALRLNAKVCVRTFLYPTGIPWSKELVL